MAVHKLKIRIIISACIQNSNEITSASPMFSGSSWIANRYRAISRKGTAAEDDDRTTDDIDDIGTTKIQHFGKRRRPTSTTVIIDEGRDGPTCFLTGEDHGRRHGFHPETV